MKKSEKRAIITAIIYNCSPKTKAEIRAESEVALKAFLRRGGVIEKGRPARARKSKMASKSSRGYVRGTSGFAVGYPRKSGL